LSNGPAKDARATPNEIFKITGRKNQYKYLGRGRKNHSSGNEMRQKRCTHVPPVSKYRSGDDRGTYRRAARPSIVAIPVVLRSAADKGSRAAGRTPCAILDKLDLQ
jgi:hypothetical protein